MTTEQPYTPSEARVCIDYCNAVVARRKADPSIGMAEADAEFDRFIEAVKRDAARKGYRAGYNDRQAERDYDHAYPEETL